MVIDQILLDYFASTDEGRALTFYEETNKMLEFDLEACMLRKQLKQLLADQNYKEIIQILSNNTLTADEGLVSAALLKLHLISMIVTPPPMHEAVVIAKNICLPLASGQKNIDPESLKLWIDRTMTFLLNSNLEPSLKQDLNIDNVILNLYTPERVKRGKVMYEKLANIELIS